MKKWAVVYFVGDTYKCIYVHADSAEKAIETAKTKNIVYLIMIEEEKRK